MIVTVCVLVVALVVAVFGFGFFAGVSQGAKVAVVFLGERGLIMAPDDEMTVEEMVDGFEGPQN
jgi:uncharacterized membrane protein YtjA (UPF0391 family)